MQVMNTGKISVPSRSLSHCIVSDTSNEVLFSHLEMNCTLNGSFARSIVQLNGSSADATV